jgi:hypothetical protein
VAQGLLTNDEITKGSPPEQLAPGKMGAPGARRLLRIQRYERVQRSSCLLEVEVFDPPGVCQFPYVGVGRSRAGPLLADDD